MAWQHNPTIWLPLAIVAACVGLIVVATRRRHLPSRRVGLVASIVTALWATAYILQLSSAEMHQAYTWMCIATIAPAGLPLFWFIVAYRLTYPRSRMIVGTGVLLAIIPAISMWLLWFPGLGGPMAASGSMVDVKGVQTLQVSIGPWFRVYMAYIVTLMCLTIAMLAVRSRHLAPVPRRRANTMLAAVILLLVFNALYAVGWIPWRRLHPASMTALATQVVFLWGILTTPVIDVRPVARELVIESMRDGLIVLDTDRRIVDISPAAVMLLGIKANQVLGEAAENALAPWPELALISQQPQARTIELEMAHDHGGASSHWVEARMQPLTKSGHQIGHIATLRDITIRKQAELERERLVEQLRGALAEVKTLQGLLSVCAWCGKIHQEDGTWVTLDEYVETHLDASVTHGICPECAQKFARDTDALAKGSAPES